MTQAQAKEVAEPSRITVVTSETLEQYIDEQMGIVNPTPEEVAAIELEKIEAEKAAKKSSEEDVTHDIPEVPKDKKGKLNERFSELTSARKAAEEKANKLAEEIQAERQAREESAKEAAELRAKYEPPKKDELGPEPLPAQFNDVNEYAKALKEWTSDKVRHEDRIQQAETQAKKVWEETAKNWKTRQDAAKVKLPDYQQVIEASSSMMISDQVRDAILESEVGPEIQYHLVKNPDLVKDIAKMSISKALKEIVKIELSLGEEHVAKAKTPIAEISKAPAPITPIKGGSLSTDNKVNSDGEFMGTYEEWKSLRKAGKIK